MENVYKYKVFDINFGEMKFVDSYATERYINNIEGAIVLYSTVISVSSNQLNGDGKLLIPYNTGI